MPTSPLPTCIHYAPFPLRHTANLFPLLATLEKDNVPCEAMWRIEMFSTIWKSYQKMMRWLTCFGKSI